MDPADQLYEAIRRDEGDVEAIARHTGWKPAGIARVKRHLFVHAHHLDAYEMLGVAPELARFDSDRVIAGSWLRLKAGFFTVFDLQLLRHETAEAWYMRKHGPSYRRAHAAAQKRFPAPAELWS
ncbi:MAG: hypothetical protein P4L85_04100 [Paludisphaera borealis]|uniref:hypothetical protein n=1 Tax=Paludisphaera borealis TaxID=1387353 RepID=UPI002842A31E|nr:hypothetical protein [Paludisphaera borealis]MDR3618510.1 hypothetical protein [Paludisphaera borealis]